MAANDGEHPVTEIFPGIVLPQSTGAPGGSGASGRAADAVEAGPVSIQGTGVWQAGARYDGGQTAVNQPDQVADSPISPGPEADYVSTGAGEGSPSHYPRHSWQAPDGRQ